MRPAAILAAAILLLGRDASGLSRGTTGADFLKLATGVRAVSMGNSYAAVAEDIYSLYWNPAGIANLQASEVLVSPVRLFDQKDIAGAYLFTVAGARPGFPFGWGSMAAGMTVLTTGDFDSTDPEAAIRAASGGASDQLFFLSYGMPASYAVSLGATVKLVRRTLSGADPASYVVDPVTGESIATQAKDFSAMGVGLDLGVLWENMDRTIAIGASVQNMGQIGGFQDSALSASFGEGAEMLPMAIRLGGAWRTQLMSHGLLATLDISSYFEEMNAPRMALGAEYGLFEMAFLRLGWEQPLSSSIGGTDLDYGPSSGLASLPSPLRGGVGVRWPVSKSSELQFDYALAPFGTLGVVHQAAMLFRWNIPQGPRGIAGRPRVSKKAAKPILVIEPKQIRFQQPVKEWKVEVLDEQGKVVKTFAGTGLPPKSLDWDGTDERGRPVTSVSRFKLVLRAKDVKNKQIRATSTLATVRAEPQLVAVAGDDLYPEVLFRLPAGEYQSWKFSVLDGKKPVKIWEGKGTPRRTVQWDGKDAAGRVARMRRPRYSWDFLDQEGQRSRGDRGLPQVEAEIKPESFGNRIRLIGIGFEDSKSAVTEEHLTILRKASRFIEEHPGSSLAIESFADASGSDETNRALAQRRAERVLHLLVDTYRLAASRVSMRVYGRSRRAPRYPGIPASRRQRVDILIDVRR